MMMSLRSSSEALRSVTLLAPARPAARGVPTYNSGMQRKMFWTIWTVLGLLADLALPLEVGSGATIPLGDLSWWIAYRSGWF